MIDPEFRIMQGDARHLVATLDQVHCVVTSPPYWKQRLYGDDPQEIGQEAAVEDFIDGLVDLFASINLHPQGSIWVNLGDKRGSKGLMCIPEMFVLAMLSAGFVLIDKVIWAKSEALDDGTTVGNCMTEPCKDRLNGNGFEPFYHFARSKDIWSDTLSVQLQRANVPTARYLPEDLMSSDSSLNGRNLHNVWRIGQGQTKERHYAVYPPILCERPIAMNCPIFINPDGSLPRRLVEQIEYDEGRGRRSFGKQDDVSSVAKKGRQDTGRQYTPKMPISKGWESISEDASQGIVFDPFVGTGTTGSVALKLGRSFIGIDLYESNCLIARQRCNIARDYVAKTYGYQKVYQIITRDQSYLFDQVQFEDSLHEIEAGSHSD